MTVQVPPPSTVNDIIRKVRRITGRPNQAQISDQEIINYVNTFYIFDMPEHIRLESLKYNYQFVTTANVQVYNMPTDIWLDNMPPVYIGGYQSYMTQDRENFFRINPGLNFLQQSVATGNGNSGNYTFTLTNTPITKGYLNNTPRNSKTPYLQVVNWNVLITAQGNADPVTGISPWYSLVDDGTGNLYDPTDTAVSPLSRGIIDYVTGDVISAVFSNAIPQGNPINAQYVPYVPSRPQSILFFQDQFLLYPIPDQAYQVSIEAYKYPIQFVGDQLGGTYTEVPQVKEWWQLISLGACLKIFEDYGDFENIQKYRPLMDEQMRLCLRRSIVQQASERTASIYTEQAAFAQYPFGNLFSGF